jgi:CDP-paratose 2-epimerase
MKILITGAAGFIGTNAVLHFYKKGWEVIPLDSFTRRGAEINARTISESCPGVAMSRCEIEDMPTKIYLEKPDVVLHFAAQVAVTSSIESPLRDFKINAEGSFHIARAASEVGAPVIYTSTNKVYGDNANRVEIVEHSTRYDFASPYQRIGLPETFSVDAPHHTPYGISKLVGEFYVREFGGIANRCSCMYGPNQFGIADQGWISHIATNKVLRRPTIIYGNGKQVRDLLHVEDVMRLLDIQVAALLGSDADRFRGEVFNVGGGPDRTISLIELCEMWGIEPSFEDWRPADQKVFYCDISKAHRLLGWKPEVSVDVGLNEIMQWTVRSVT